MINEIKKEKLNITVSLINFHFAHNYGAVLQCLALQTLLQKRGYDLHVIDYRPYYQQQYYTRYANPFRCMYWRYKLLWGEKKSKRIFQSVRWGACVICGYRQAGRRGQLEEAFDPFVRRNLCLTKRYNSLKELQKHPPKSDVYICGSDQVWNPLVTSGVDPAYYLDFGSDNHYRIAYAVSPCQALDTKYHRLLLSRLLGRFDAISLREAEKKAELEEHSNKSISICLDPTLLLHADDYYSFEEKIEDCDQYVLVYAFKETTGGNRIIGIVHEMQQRMKLRVIDISFEKIAWDIPVTKRFGITPGQFLTYFRNAAFVVTNSFHGTAFSIIYRRPFLSIPKDGTAQRMTELLNKLELGNCLAANNILPIGTPMPDYDHIAKRLEILCAESQQFLSQALGDVEKGDHREN
ncbi:polysaccharide pyruvyl transferase family protein [Desulfosporosinus sp. SYSU MS00001]|uniref:polysaccharide pyruvyl transferase family protein n=1 Tax=Desulfosporosinus sp. SYSU MS00001 TaxID=3416284 RepID=UPI003CF33C09